MRCAEGAKAFVLGVEHWTLGDYIQTIDATNIMASEFIFSCQVPSPFLRSHAGRRQKIYQKGVNHLFFRNFIILWAQRRYLGHWKRSSWQVESHGHYMKACCAFLKTLPVVKKEVNFLYSKRFNLTHLMRRFFYYDPFPSHQNMDSFYYCPFRSFPNFLFHVGSLHWKYLQSPEVEGNKCLKNLLLAHLSTVEFIKEEHYDAKSIAIQHVLKIQLFLQFLHTTISFLS